MPEQIQCSECMQQTKTQHVAVAYIVYYSECGRLQCRYDPCIQLDDTCINHIILTELRYRIDHLSLTVKYACRTE